MICSFSIRHQVSFPHAYFDSGLAEGLVVEPAASSASSVRGGSLEFKAQTGGFLLIGKDGDSSELPTQGSRAFTIRAEGPFFAMITQLPAPSEGVLYANNLSEDGWQTLPCKPAAWSYSLEAAIAAAPIGRRSAQDRLQAGAAVLCTYRVLHANGELALEAAELQLLRQIDLDFQGLGDGQYSLEVSLDGGGTLEPYHFVYSAALAWKPGIGLYEYFESPPSTKGSESKASTLSVPDQALPFKAIQSYWRYFLFSQRALEPTQCKIQNGELNGTEVKFGFPKATIAPNGQQALCFTSSKPIPLKQAPSGAVKLELLGQYWGVLPYPNPGHSYEKKLGKLRPVSDVSIRV